MVNSNMDKETEYLIEYIKLAGKKQANAQTTEEAEYYHKCTRIALDIHLNQVDFMKYDIGDLFVCNSKVYALARYASMDMACFVEAEDYEKIENMQYYAKQSLFSDGKEIVHSECISYLYAKPKLLDLKYEQ